MGASSSAVLLLLGGGLLCALQPNHGHVWKTLHGGVRVQTVVRLVRTMTAAPAWAASDTGTLLLLGGHSHVTQLLHRMPAHVGLCGTV